MRRSISRLNKNFLNKCLIDMEGDKTNKLSCPNDLIKYLHPPSHGKDEGRQAINKKFQCLGELPISC